MNVTTALASLQQYYQSGATRTYAFRRQQLMKLKATILQYEAALYEALYSDLKKSKEEVWATETGMVIAECNETLRHLHRWMKPEKVRTNWINFPSSSSILKEPLGVVLIIAPWNYPFQLLFNPLIGALAAGNCVVLKPSEFAPATSAVMQQIIHACFDQQYVWYVTGDGATVVPQLMQQYRFDHVFYTGSTVVGQRIYQMAADKLVPVTLELGGKSPCIVEADADIAVAAKRIALTKFNNAGQTCVAPDYVLVHHTIKDQLVAALKTAVAAFYGDKPAENYNYGKIINRKQFDRLVQYLQQGHVLHGGHSNAATLHISPTLMDDVPLNSALMQQEIFGPILPIHAFDTTETAQQIIAMHPNPLAFYVFTSSRQTEKRWLQLVPAGGCCVNNACWHLTNPALPFGGRGASGIGAYHGRSSFDTFSHRKPVMRTPTWFDPALKYPPFEGKLSLLKRFIR